MASTAPAAIGAAPIAARVDALPVTRLHWAIVLAFGPRGLSRQPVE